MTNEDAVLYCDAFAVSQDSAQVKTAMELAKTALRQMTIKDVMDAIEKECESRETCDGCRFAITHGHRLLCFQGRMWEILSDFVEGESEVPKL